MGIFGEYVTRFYTQVLKRQLVIKKQRINFKGSPGSRLQKVWKSTIDN
jgi:hypothetical protein